MSKPRQSLLRLVEIKVLLASTLPFSAKALA